jgi:hypothetical protein
MLYYCIPSWAKNIFFLQGEVLGHDPREVNVPVISGHAGLRYYHSLHRPGVFSNFNCYQLLPPFLFISRWIVQNCTIQRLIKRNGGSTSLRTYRMHGGRKVVEVYCSLQSTNTPMLHLLCTMKEEKSVPQIPFSVSLLCILIQFYDQLTVCTLVSYVWLS